MFVASFIAPLVRPMVMMTILRKNEKAARREYYREHGVEMPQPGDDRLRMLYKRHLSKPPLPRAAITARSTEWRQISVVLVTFVAFVAGGFVHKVVSAIGTKQLETASNFMEALLWLSLVPCVIAELAVLINKPHALRSRTWWLIFGQGLAMVGLGAGFFEASSW